MLLNIEVHLNLTLIKVTSLIYQLCSYETGQSKNIFIIVMYRKYMH